jgi:L-threonylcarbamoyladenylate synthase
LLVKDLEQIKQIAKIDSKIENFINEYSPGPITYILNRKEDFIMSSLINSRNATIGVRIPDHPIAQQILTLFGRPIIGTSTNLSGKESAINVNGIDSHLLSSISIVIDDGPTKFGMGSTIVDLTNPQEFKILREGALIIK